MLLVVADQGTVLVPQGNHVDITDMLWIVVGIDDVMACISGKPLDHLADGFHRMRVVAVQQAFAQQGSAAVFL